MPEEPPKDPIDFHSWAQSEAERAEKSVEVPPVPELKAFVEGLSLRKDDERLIFEHMDKEFVQRQLALAHKLATSSQTPDHAMVIIESLISVLESLA